MHVPLHLVVCSLEYDAKQNPGNKKNDRLDFIKIKKKSSLLKILLRE